MPVSVPWYAVLSCCVLPFSWLILPIPIDSLLTDKGIPNLGEVFTLNFLDLENKDDSIRFTSDYWSDLGIDFKNKEMWKT